MPKNRQERALGKNYVHQKKMLRLIFNKNLSQRDFFRINQIYEQKQHENFYYAFSIPVLTSGLIYMHCRKMNSRLKFMYMGCGTFITYMFFHFRANSYYEQQIQPYFEKYQIK